LEELIGGQKATLQGERHIRIELAMIAPLAAAPV
jgi:hypothetical protein